MKVKKDTASGQAKLSLALQIESKRLGSGYKPEPAVDTTHQVNYKL